MNSEVNLIKIYQTDSKVIGGGGQTETEGQKHREISTKP
jgi:hypothetical protein